MSSTTSSHLAESGSTHSSVPAGHFRHSAFLLTAVWALVLGYEHILTCPVGWGCHDIILCGVAREWVVSVWFVCGGEGGKGGGSGNGRGVRAFDGRMYLTKYMMKVFGGIYVFEKICLAAFWKAVKVSPVD
ncbi:hypothetical protein BKA82DRAFT_4013935 [Pisolithus tinctorius]|nr:hypothetical protein BKA82DRAFT_4013935 [Pisolithus tinctorius]